MERRIHNPWFDCKTVSGVFWIDGGRRHCSVFVLGPFCSISHSSTLRLKGWTNPTIHSQVFVFVLARGGCGRGASALPLTARQGAPFCCWVVWRGAAPSNVCAAGPPAGRSVFPLVAADGYLFLFVSITCFSEGVSAEFSEGVSAWKNMQ
jgi:hypothetical protein